MLWTWFFTVATSMQRRAAISLFDEALGDQLHDLALAHCQRRDVRAQRPRAPSELTRRSSVVAMRGGKLASPRAALTTPRRARRVMRLALDEAEHAQLRERDHLLVVVRRAERDDRRVGVADQTPHHLGPSASGCVN